MTETKDATVTLRLSADEKALLQAKAEQEGVSLAVLARRGIKAVLAGTAVLAVALTLTACGSAEQPSTAPVATQAPQVAVQVPVSPEATSEEAECWTDPALPGNPHWFVQFDALSGDPVRAVAMLDELPEPSAGCGAAEQASLAYAQEVAANMRERFPELFAN